MSYRSITEWILHDKGIQDPEHKKFICKTKASLNDGKKESFGGKKSRIKPSKILMLDRKGCSKKPIRYVITGREQRLWNHKPINETIVQKVREYCTKQKMTV